MVLSSSKDAVQRPLNFTTIPSISTFPAVGYLESLEQIRRFELLRLAFFVLKLRKQEQRLLEAQEEPKGMRSEREFRCSLLRHVIFQQVVTLIRLDAREQAMQIIEACRK